MPPVPRFVRGLGAVVLVAGLTALVAPVGPAQAAPAGQVLYSDSSSESYYTRVTRAGDGTLLTTFQTGSQTSPYNSAYFGTTHWPFRRSSNDGQSWSPAGALDIDLPGVVNSGCCPALWTMPQQLGSFPAGTLLFAVTLFGNSGDTRQTRIYRSTDNGTNWQLHSVPITGGYHWEPEFTVDSQGRLVMYFSDERQQPQYSQTIAHVVSTDGGLTWGPRVNDVASSDSRARPGMPRVVKMSNGQYVMAYEVCGTEDCTVHTRTSGDGTSWGNPADLGPVVTSTNGRTLHSAPAIAWMSDAHNSAGRLVVTAKYGREADGSIAGNAGDDVFVNDHAGSGSWYPMAAPFSVDSRNSAGYSSSLFPIGDRLLMVAGSFNSGIGHSEVRYGFSTFTPAPVGQTVALQAQANSRYLSAWLDEPNAPVQARGLAIQAWEKFTVVDAGDGLVALRSAANGKYVSAWADESFAPLEARADRISTWEQFQWLDLGGGRIAVRASANGQLVSAWNDTANTPLQARAGHIQVWEQMTWSAL